MRGTLFLTLYFNMILFTILSALLLYLSVPNFFSHFGFAPAAWLFAMPLCHVLNRENIVRRVLAVLLFAFIFFGLLVSWLISYNFWGYCLLVITLSLPVMLFGILYRPSFKKPFLDLFYVPAAWVACEYICRVSMDGFLWSVAYSQSFQPLILQFANLFGTHGLSFALVLVGCALNRITADYKNRYAYMGIVLAVPILLAGYGYGTLSNAANDSSVLKTYPLILIQPDISMKDKLNSVMLEQNVEQHIILTEQSLAHYPRRQTLIIWPETAINDDLDFFPDLKQRISNLAKDNQVYLLFGMAALRNHQDYNSIVLVDPAGDVKTIYDKTRLVPFSEHNFQSGQTMGTFSLNAEDEDLQVGAVICSEDLYPGFIRELAKQDIDFAILILNDGWFSREEALFNHLQPSIFRAVENGIPIARVSNNGVSAVIDPWGRIDPRYFQIINKSVYVSTAVGVSQRETTLYREIGDIFAVFCVGFVIMNLIVKLKVKNEK
jgi:apolipoprotein N-acyltransferase